MTTAKWMTLPVTRVATSLLLPTQWGVNEEIVAMKTGRRLYRSSCGDPFPHLVLLGGDYFIEDGHHRITAAKRAHLLVMWVRVFDPSEVSHQNLLTDTPVTS